MKEELIKQFIKDCKKVTEPREHKVTSSLGVYDAYKYIRKNKWLNIGLHLTEHQFYTIIRTINIKLALDVANSKEVIFPELMGKLELRKFKTKIKVENGKLITSLPIDWDRTLRLWATDEQAKKDKTLVRIESKDGFKVFYNKQNAKYVNSSFYEFNINRDIKQAIKAGIKNNKLDAFII